MNIKEHIRKVETLKSAEEIILVCANKAHEQILLGIINMQDIAESTIEAYTRDVEQIRKLISKIYSRQTRNGTQIVVENIEEIIKILESDSTLTIPDDIVVSYSDLLDFTYQEKHYILESIETLEQDVFKYFDLYYKLNSMYYIGVYRTFEYVISILLEDDQKAVEEKTIVACHEQSFKENQLIVLFKGANNLNEMITDYAISFRRWLGGELQELGHMTTYTNEKLTTREKCLYFIKEFYAYCRYLQGKYGLEHILIIGSDAKEYMRIIYNMAGMVELMEMKQFEFKDEVEGWKDEIQAILEELQ